jgi:hypothetical protein
LPLPAPAVKMAKWVGLLATTPSASRPVMGGILNGLSHENYVCSFLKAHQFSQDVKITRVSETGCEVNFL